jgi:hypothetical protein
MMWVGSGQLSALFVAKRCEEWIAQVVIPLLILDHFVSWELQGLIYSKIVVALAVAGRCSYQWRSKTRLRSPILPDNSDLLRRHRDNYFKVP